MKNTDSILAEFKEGFDKVRYEYSIDSPDDPMYQLVKYSEDFILKALKSQEEAVRKSIIKEIDPFDLVEPCNPDCTPEEHAYHQGTWDSYLKLEKKLKSLKEVIK